MYYRCDICYDNFLNMYDAETHIKTRHHKTFPSFHVTTLGDVINPFNPILDTQSFDPPTFSDITNDLPSAPADNDFTGGGGDSGGGGASSDW